MITVLFLQIEQSHERIKRFDEILTRLLDQNSLVFLIVRLAFEYNVTRYGVRYDMSSCQNDRLPDN